MKNLEYRIFLEASLHRMSANRCNETMFINCFITPDAYIREYCPKYIQLFREIDLNRNGKIDIHEIMYHISKVFQYPETMRDYFTTVVKLLDSDGDNELNLVEFVKYCISLNKLLGISNGNDITKEHMLMVLYELVDIDGSGLLDKREMKRYFLVLNTPIEVQLQITQIMNECGGIIDFEIFKLLYQE